MLATHSIVRCDQCLRLPWIPCLLPYILALEFHHKVGSWRPGDLHDLLQLVQVWRHSGVKGHTGVGGACR